MDLIQLLRQSEQKNHGRTLTVEQIRFLLNAMGRMAFDRHQAMQAFEYADTMLDAYINEFGEELMDTLIEEELAAVEAEVVVDDEESEASGLDSEEPRVDASEEE